MTRNSRSTSTDGQCTAQGVKLFFVYPQKGRVVVRGVEYGSVEKVRKVTLEGRFGSSRQGNYNTGPDPPQQAHIPRIQSRCTGKMTTKAEDTGVDSGASMARRLVVVAGRITCKRLAERGRVGTGNTEITRFPHQIWLSQRISLFWVRSDELPTLEEVKPKRRIPCELPGSSFPPSN